jgi:hypothetical protein
MPRYFFDLHDGETLSEDGAASECDGTEAARSEAQSALADIVRDTRPDGQQRTIALRVAGRDRQDHRQGCGVHSGRSCALACSLLLNTR